MKTFWESILAKIDRKLLVEIKTKEVKIYVLYGKDQRHYFPDFLVIDESGIHYLVEPSA